MCKLLHTYLNNYLNNLLWTIIWITYFEIFVRPAFFLCRFIQSWKNLDDSGLVETILMYLSKAYDCLSHDLFNSKIWSILSWSTSVNLGNDYLSFRKQRTKIGSLFNDCAHVTWGIRQRSILGTLFRSIFINNIFFLVGKICYMQICQDDSL